MEINQERLDEIKVVFAERHQISTEEASRIVDNGMTGVIRVGEWVKPFAEEIARIWRSLKEIFQENYEKASWKSVNESMWGWNINWDTRKRSQVMSNNPKFMVRKIIR